MRNSVSEPPQLKLKLQPRDPVASVSLSSSHLPVSDHPKIHPADQLGSVCLGGFHGGRSFLQNTPVFPTKNPPSHKNPKRPHHYPRIEPYPSPDYFQYQGFTHSHGDF